MNISLKMIMDQHAEHKEIKIMSQVPEELVATGVG
jgi:hypothetical protein